MTTKNPSKTAAPKAVTREEFSELRNDVADLVNLMRESLARPTTITVGDGSGASAHVLPGSKTDLPKPTLPVAEKDPQVAREVAKAAPNRYQVNEEWEEMARDIIGEAVDHTETQHLKGGGLLFTVVIKEEFSNAPGEYLERHKVDRRSREVGSDGEAGVKVWCDLIKSNLTRGQVNA